jgi:hypothetical protein
MEEVEFIFCLKSLVNDPLSTLRREEKHVIDVIGALLINVNNFYVNDFLMAININIFGIRWCGIFASVVRLDYQTLHWNFVLVYFKVDCQYSLLPYNSP